MSEIKMTSLERCRSIIRDAVNRNIENRNEISQTEVTSYNVKKFEMAKAPSCLEFEEKLGHTRCRLEETAILRCSLTHWCNPSITWLKNSFPIEMNERISQIFDGKYARLTISRVQPSDFGCFECVAMTNDVKCYTAGTLLLESCRFVYMDLLLLMMMMIIFICEYFVFSLNADSVADRPLRVQKIEIQQTNYNDILRRTSPSENKNKEDIKRSVIQRLEAAKNRYTYQPTCPDLNRKKSLCETKHSQATFRVEPNLQRSATTIRQKLLEWCKIQLRDYENVEITNFTTSWNDGLAFCALIHRFCPEAFDYDRLNPNDTRHNFQLAFDTAAKHGVTPLLDVEDMVRMKVPDWKCIFMYVESLYRAFAVNKNPTSIAQD